MAASLINRIRDGRTDLVFEHLVAGGAANACDDNGVSLISWCAYYGDVSAIRRLLQNAASLESLGPNLDLNGAAFHGHWRLCEFLIEHGADVNHPLSDTGECPLHAATCTSNRPAFEHVVRVLLAGGADPNSVTKPGIETGCFMRDCRTRGETPLHRAASFGTERTIRLLLDAGADIDARDIHGDSPLSWASWHARPTHIIALLCSGDHRIHTKAIEQSRMINELGWRMMEHHLLGNPHE